MKMTEFGFNNPEKIDMPEKKKNSISQIYFAQMLKSYEGLIFC